MFKHLSYTFEGKQDWPVYPSLCMSGHLICQGSLFASCVASGQGCLPCACLDIYFARVALPAALLLARAPLRPSWEWTPSMRWLELRFLTTTIWKQVAEPWREAMVE